MKHRSLGLTLSHNGLHILGSPVDGLMNLKNARGLLFVCLLCCAMLGRAQQQSPETEPSSDGTTPSVTTATVIGGGTTNFIPKWTSSSALGNSIIFQTPGGNIGVGITTPGAKLDVNGSGQVRGLFLLPAMGTATTTKGFPSHNFEQDASVFNSNFGVAIAQKFRWQVLPVKNNTANATGALALLFGSGGNTPAPTGFSINANGTLNFVGGQVFPGTGTVSSVGSGAGLTGGPITTSGTLSIANGGVTNAMLVNPSLTVTAGTALTGGGPVALGGSTTLNVDTTKVPLLAASNTFTQGQGIVQSVSKCVFICPFDLSLQQTTSFGNGILMQLGGAGVIFLAQVAGSDVFRVDGTGKVFADGGFASSGADFAESVAVSGDRTRYQAGDLLVVDEKGNRRLTLAQEAYSTRVAGIYSTKPGMLASQYAMDDQKLAAEVPLAVMGIVPCKVTTKNGSIKPGDLLVASSVPGHAMKGTVRSRMLGAVVGKAMEPLHKGEGIIQVLVTLQ